MAPVETLPAMRSMSLIVASALVAKPATCGDSTIRSS
jgi:hypothetical protein